MLCASHCYVQWSCVFLEMAERWPWEMGNELLALLCLHAPLLIPIKLSLSQPLTFLTFYFSDNPSCPIMMV